MERDSQKNLSEMNSPKHTFDYKKNVKLLKLYGKIRKGNTSHKKRKKDFGDEGDLEIRNKQLSNEDQRSATKGFDQ